MPGINGEDQAVVSQWSVRCGFGGGLGSVEPSQRPHQEGQIQDQEEGVGFTGSSRSELEKLPQHHQLLWHILRWSGAHASEVGGLRWEDIDLHEEVIHFRSHKTRPLKNAYRVRTIPIHPRLLPILSQEQLDEPCEELIFPWAYSPKRARWCEAMHWHKIIGVSPKATRDWAATCLRSKDINESVIGRLFGNTPKTQTGVYGAVCMDTLRRAIELLE